MAYGDLTQDDLDVAFAFARSESGAYRDAAGTLQVAAPDAPRFDHDEAGLPRGLLLSPGADLGGGDRLAIEPLILPTGFDAGTECTVLHLFAPLVVGDAEWVAEHRAWYSRNAAATIDAVLAQAGHHLSIGIVPGFRPNEAGPGEQGFVRFRGVNWKLTGILASAGSRLGDGSGGMARPLIVAGAEAP